MVFILNGRNESDWDSTSGTTVTKDFYPLTTPIDEFGWNSIAQEAKMPAKWSNATNSTNKMCPSSKKTIYGQTFARTSSKALPKTDSYQAIKPFKAVWKSAEWRFCGTETIHNQASIGNPSTVPSCLQRVGHLGQVWSSKKFLLWEWDHPRKRINFTSVPEAWYALPSQTGPDVSEFNRSNAGDQNSFSQVPRREPSMLCSSIAQVWSFHSIEIRSATWNYHHGINGG